MQKARYRAENNANDNGGTFNGTRVGGSSFTPSKYGSAFLLDGVDDVVTIDDGDLLWPSGSFTLEAWIKTTATTTSGVINKFACGDQCPASLSYAAFGVGLYPNGTPGFSFRPDATAVVTSVTATLVAVNDGNWHHIVAVRDSSAMMSLLYVDGTLAVSTSAAAAQFGPMTNADSNVDLVVLGGSVTANQTTLNGFFNGALDEIAIYHSALTAAQVSAIYMAPDGKCL